MAGLINDFFEMGITADNIVIKNPYSIKTYRESFDKDTLNELRYTVPDVKAEIMSSSDFISEMQLYVMQTYMLKSLYYTTETFGSNYGRDNIGGDKYGSLRSVYSLNILGPNFKLFKDEEPCHCFELYDEMNKVVYPGRPLQITVFELSKQGGSITNNQRHWMDYFLERELQPDAPEYIKRAKSIINTDNMKKEEIEMISRVEKAEADYHAMLDSARNEGLAFGREEGRAIGIAQGVQQGMQQGIQQGMQQGIQQGMQQGLQKGMLQGKISVLLDIGKSKDEILSILKITEDTYEEAIRDISIAS